MIADPALKCLVLGGSGFIGHRLVAALLDRGFLVRSFDRLPHADGNQASHRNFEFVQGDFTNENDIARALDGCKLCFHLISTTLPSSSNKNPIFDIESNLAASVRLMNRAIQSGVKKIIFASSGGTVYGIPTQVPIPESHSTFPTCSYGITKLAIEKYLHLFHTLYGLDFTVLRLGNPFGEGQRVQASQGAIAVFLGKALRGEPIEIWGDGSVVRDYIHIDDVTDAFISAIDAPASSHEVFNIGAGRGHSLNEVLQMIEAAIERKVDRRYVHGRNFDVPVNVLNIDKAMRELRWSPKVGFADGLKRYAQWLKASEFLQALPR